MSDADVVIVGARAAGAATALLLARAGLDVLLVERSTALADTLSTHALMKGAVIQLHRWGLLDAVISAGTPPLRRTTFHTAAGSNTIEMRPDQGIDALYAPRRTVLDPILLDAAVAAGAKVRFGWQAVGLLTDDAGRVGGLAVRDRRGGERRIAARLVVGADGRDSAIARLVDAPVERGGHGASAYLYRYVAGMATDGYEWVFRPSVSAGIIPTNDELTCVFVGCRPARAGRGERDLFGRLLREASDAVAESVGRGTPVGPVRRFPGRPGRMLRPWGEGWALVGDAGYWKDPISAHGLTDALRDAELLARAVLDTDGRDDRGDVDLRRYGEERNGLSDDLFTITDRIAGGEWTDAEIGGLLRALSQSMTDEVTALQQLDARPAARAPEPAEAVRP